MLMTTKRIRVFMRNQPTGNGAQRFNELVGHLILCTHINGIVIKTFTPRMFTLYFDRLKMQV